MLLDIVEQRERLMRAHTVFTRVHAHITGPGGLGELEHLMPDDHTPAAETQNPAQYSEVYEAETRGWSSLYWKIEPTGPDVCGKILFRVEVILAIRDLGAETDTWEGASLGIVWTEKDGWAAEHYEYEGEPRIEEIVDTV